LRDDLFDLVPEIHHGLDCRAFFCEPGLKGLQLGFGGLFLVSDRS
jgi:hypothetical protein